MMTFDTALAHLRAAYPQGVSSEQSAPLAELLARTVGVSRAEELLQALDVPTDALAMRGPISPDRLSYTAARLAGAGWPLAGPGQDEPSKPGYVARIMNWLRAGYPQGVPAKDYIPVLAVLRPQLDDADMAAIAEQLAQDARAEGTPPSEADARAAIHRATEDEPTEDEVERVRTLLAAHGWPFEGE